MGGPPLLLSLVALLIMKDLKECGMTFSGLQCRNSITFFMKWSHATWQICSMNQTFTAFITFFVPRISSILGSFGSEWKLSTEGTDLNGSYQQKVIAAQISCSYKECWILIMNLSQAQLSCYQIAGNCTIARKRKSQRTVNTNMEQKHKFATKSS